MRHKGLLAILVIFAILCGSFLAGVLTYLFVGGEEAGAGWFGEKGVGVVTVEGPILSSKEIIEDIERFRDDEDIASAVVRIESPGGLVAASQEILEAMKELGKKKPVVASMGSVAASGGYYVACGATKIFANPGTITGSIGVRMEHVMIGDLLKWMKIKRETLKSGKFKDLASIDRPLTPEERAILEGVLADIHRQFKEAVAKARNLDLDEVGKIADGRIFTGREAKDLGLVDELGGFTEALRRAGDLGGIKGEPKPVYPKRRYHLVERLLARAKTALDGGSTLFLDWWQPVLVWQTSKPTMDH